MLRKKPFFTIITILLLVTAGVGIAIFGLNINHNAVAQINQVDPNFRTDSVFDGVYFDLGLNNDEYPAAIAVDNQGNYYVAGVSIVGWSQEKSVFVCKIDQDGQLDSEFGNYPYDSESGIEEGGCALITSSSIDELDTQDIIVNSDGSIVIAGLANINSSTNMRGVLLLKLDNLGQVDTSFGNSSCTNQTPSGGGEGEGGSSGYGCFTSVTDTGNPNSEIISLAKSGSNYIISGQTENSLTVWAVNSNGVLIDTFGDGSCTNGVGQDSSYGCTQYYAGEGFTTGGNSVLVDSNGKIVVAGNGTNDASDEFSIITRLNSNGTFDTSFGDGECPNGVGEGSSYGCSLLYAGSTVIEDPFEGEITHKHKISFLSIAQDSTKYIISGSYGQYCERDWCDMEYFGQVWRYNSDGTLDSSLDNGTCQMELGFTQGAGCISHYDYQSGEAYYGFNGDTFSFTDIVVDHGCKTDNIPNGWCQPRYSLTGLISGGEGAGDYFLLRYNSNGEKQLEMSSSSGLTGYSTNPRLLLDDNGNYLLGALYEQDYDRDVYLLRINNRYQISGLDETLLYIVNEIDISVGTPDGTYGDSEVFISIPGEVFYTDILTQPAGIGVNEDEFIYIADRTNHCIQIFDSEGAYVDFMGKECDENTGTGNQNGEFSAPADVAFDQEGNIYVLDAGNYRVQKFNSNREFVSSWGEATEGGYLENGTFGTMRSIEVDSTGNIYVSDFHRIQKFGNDGTYILTIGGDGSGGQGSGSGNGQFNTPNGIVYDNINDLIYVADSGNYRVQSFETNGSFNSAWDTFAYTLDVAVDADGSVYTVSDNVLRKYQSDGFMLEEWGETGDALGAMFDPQSLSLHQSTGHIYVSEFGNQRVQKFGPSGEGLITFGDSIQREIFPIAEVLVDIRDDRDWSGVTRSVSRQDGKSYIHGLANAPGTEMPFYLYIAKLENSAGAHVCPGIDNLGAIDMECSSGYTLIAGEDAGIEEVTYLGYDYWKISDVYGSGGMNILQSGDEESDPGEEQNAPIEEQNQNESETEDSTTEDDSTQLTQSGSSIIVMFLLAILIVGVLLINRFKPELFQAATIQLEKIRKRFSQKNDLK